MTTATPLGAPRSEASVGELVLAAYQPLAPYYDRFTEETQYDKWLVALDGWARAEGLTGTQLLDVACGTGKSFEPMLARGYEVTACDLSPAMVAEARRRSRGAAEVVVADMRRLPWESRFDLITCIDDAVNYLLTTDDLARALGSMAAALRPGGMLVFDTNSEAMYLTSFAQTFEVESGSLHFRWCGDGGADFKPGQLSSATLEIRGPAGTIRSRHVQRHWPAEALRSACTSAGFESVRFRGQLTGCHLQGHPNEHHHTKVVCLAVKPSSRAGGRR